MNDEPEKPKLELPEALASRLREFEGRLRVVETLAAVLGGACGMLLGFALVFASDRFWDTPLWLRLAVLAGFVAAVAWFSSRWMRNWLWHRRDARALARLVQKHYPRLGDRLLGAVELAADGDVKGISPALRRAAVQQVAQEAEKYDFKAAVETRRTRRYVVAGVVLAALAGAAFVFFPQAGRNALSRWLNPLAETPRYTFVSLEAMPAELRVAHGEEFEIACKLSALSLWKPVTAVCQVADQQKIVAEVRGGMARFQVPGQTRAAVLRLWIGDVSRGVRIIPLFRPELVTLAAAAALPAYLQLGERKLLAENGRMKLLLGSAVRFTGTADRELAAALVKNGVELKVSVQGRRFTTDACAAEKLAPARPEPGAVQFAWTDRYGLACVAPYRLEVLVEEDAPPSLRCEGIAGTVAILADEVIEFKAEAADDYGVKRLWLDWWVDKNETRGLAEIRGAEELGAGTCGLDRTGVKGGFRFAPSVMKLPEDVMVNVQAAVTDYFPGRKPVQSPVYRIIILSRAEHAKLLQQQLQNTLTRLEDAAREEERLMQANLEFGARKPGELTGEKTTEDLRANQRGEQANQRRLEELAKELGELAKEALRNKDVSDRLLAELAKLAAEMRQTADGPMQEASQAEAQAQAQSEAAPRAEEIAKAIEQQKKALAAMRQMQKQGEKSSQNMAARNFVNRLRETAKAEGGIGAALKRVLPATVGMVPEALPAVVKAEFAGMGEAQRKARTEAQHIRDDLMGFYNRTQEAKYDAVRQAMTEPDVLEAQRALGEKLQGNLAAISIPDAAALAKKFNEWADMLDEKEEEGGGQGQGQKDNVDPALIFGLMRTRVQEESLREETRSLYEGRVKNPSYQAGAESLGERQGSLRREMKKLQAKAGGDAKIVAFIDQVANVMAETEALLRVPSTGPDTVAAETVVIEAIAKALAGCKKKSKPGDSQKQQQAIEQMMQMMGMGAQPGQGQDGAGGREGTVKGTPGGGDSEGGGAKKGSGVTAGLPEEFKDAIEEYFRALEEKK